MVCPDELTSQHYLGNGHGHGVIDPSEDVLLGVFRSTPMEGGRLCPLSFRNRTTKRQLARSDLSLARKAFTTRDIFQDKVVVPRGPDDEFVGISQANVETIRKMHAKISGLHPPLIVRSLCVTDKVTEYDFDAHATLGFCEEHDKLSINQKTTVRDVIAADLADVFGPIASFYAVFDEPQV